METWKRFNSQYEVSDEGNVRNYNGDYVNKERSGNGSEYVWLNIYSPTGEIIGGNCYSVNDLVKKLFNNDKAKSKKENTHKEKNKSIINILASWKD